MGTLLWSLVTSGVLFSNSNYVHTALTVSPTTPKSSSSLLTRLDNPVLKAGILFAQRLFSTLIASDLMTDCELLVDCGHHTVSWQWPNKSGKQWGLSFSTCYHQIGQVIGLKLPTINKCHITLHTGLVLKLFHLPVQWKDEWNAEIFIWS